MYKILVTGVSSFIGFHIAKYLSSNGNDVIGTISQKQINYDGIRQKRLTNLNNIEIDLLDVTNKENIHQIINFHKPDVFFFLPVISDNWSSLQYDIKKSYEVLLSKPILHFIVTSLL